MSFVIAALYFPIVQVEIPEISYRFFYIAFKRIVDGGRMFSEGIICKAFGFVLKIISTEIKHSAIVWTKREGGEAGIKAYLWKPRLYKLSLSNLAMLP